MAAATAYSSNINNMNRMTIAIYEQFFTLREVILLFRVCTKFICHKLYGSHQTLCRLKTKNKRKYKQQFDCIEYSHEQHYSGNSHNAAN